VRNLLTQTAWYSLLGIACLLARPLAADTFTDGFEGASINPFWTASGPGTASLTTSAAHSGSQSLQLATSPTWPWYADLSHDFGIEQMGSVSIYVQSQLCCGSSADIALRRANGDWANIQQLDTGGFQTRVFIGGVESGYFFGSSTPLSWYLFEISTDLNGVTVKLDGTTVLTNASITSFQFVDLTVWGGPAGSANYDDFSANTVAVPEPASWTLMAIIFGSFALLRRKR
jgi:hypothetical protein